jgi:hypothetical protein
MTTPKVDLYRTVLSRHKSNQSRAHVLGSVNADDHLDGSTLNSILEHRLRPSQSVLEIPVWWAMPFGASIYLLESL